MNASERSLESNQPYRRDINIEIDQLSVTGHVVFAGRDGKVHVQTGGDVAQHTHQTVTVGGVETTPQEYDLLLAEHSRCRANHPERKPEPGIARNGDARPGDGAGPTDHRTKAQSTSARARGEIAFAVLPGAHRSRAHTL